MTVLTVLDSHREDLKVLNNQPLNVLQDFCKLASTLLNKGCNAKIYQTVSQKLQLDVNLVQPAVEGIAYLFVEAGKSNLTQEEFRQAVLSLGLPEDFFATLHKEYLTQKNLLDCVLPHLGIQHFQYNNLDWRFEVQVSSRAMIKQIQPRVLLKLELKKCDKLKQICLQSDIPNIVHMNQLLAQALQDSKTHHSKRILRAVV